jgi:aspartate/methionine/tyrosine aminotransferase
MMKFQPFEMEKLMSVWEQEVDYNLSESGVHPMTLQQLLGDTGELDSLMTTELGYPMVNGTVALREQVAALYGHGAGPDNILVTVGCAEAWMITLQTLAEDGGEVAVMLPNYLHAWGTAQNVGLGVREFQLKSDSGWALDLDGLEAAVNENTRAIAICNPNNPTGYILSEAEMDAVVAAAERVGAWIIADEVYAGAERVTEVETPSFWGRYDRVLALNSLSKAYGLPGLRLGWVAGPTDMIERLWRRHEYSTLACTMLANKLAEITLSPEVRPRILERTRAYVRDGYSLLEDWLNSFDGLFEVTAPQASAIALVRYDLDIGSVDLVQRLIDEKSVLIVPGVQFGVEQHVRISFGPPPEYVSAGLKRVGELIETLAPVSV